MFVYIAGKEVIMAEAVRKSKFLFLRLMAKLFASVLSLLGIVSGCGGLDAPTYGPPAGVYFHGIVVSAEDSSSVTGIQVQLTNPDLTMVYGTTESSGTGNYYLYLEENSPPWPDSILVRATDIDGEANGSFAPKDTLILPDSDEEYQEFQIDFVLEEE